MELIDNAAVLIHGQVLKDCGTRVKLETSCFQAAWLIHTQAPWYYKCPLCAESLGRASPEISYSQNTASKEKATQRGPNDYSFTPLL